jgi:hypothetical protein
MTNAQTKFRRDDIKDPRSYLPPIAFSSTKRT